MSQIQIIEYPEERIRENSSASEIIIAQNQEGVQLFRAGNNAGLMIALDPAGKKISSIEFASLLKKWEINGPHHISIFIGGPHGLSDDIKKRSHILLSLSDMTFPHQMVRLIILEQIYRGFTINRGLPYHR